jgi:hypothetical protein
MKNVLKLFLILIVFTSCENYLDKSITIELSEKEIQQSLERDSLIYNYHKEFEVYRDTLSSNKELRNKFEPITYGDISTLREVYGKKYDSFRDSIKENILKPKWEEEFGFIDTKIDSVLSFYFDNPIDLSKYVKVELSKVDTEYYRSIGGISEVDLGFKLTPLKGTIQQLIFSFTYTPKIGGKTYSHRYRTTEPISRSVVRYWEVDYSERSLLGGRTPYTIKRDYDVSIEIEKIRYRNENLSKERDDIPFEVEMVKKYMDGDSSLSVGLTNDERDLISNLMVETYRKSVSEKVLNLKYESYDDYSRNQLEPIMDSVMDSKTMNRELMEDLFLLMYEVKKSKK